MSDAEAAARAREWAQNSEDNDARRYLALVCGDSRSDFTDACIVAGLGGCGREVSDRSRFDALLRILRRRAPEASREPDDDDGTSSRDSEPGS